MLNVDINKWFWLVIAFARLPAAGVHDDGWSVGRGSHRVSGHLVKIVVTLGLLPQTDHIPVTDQPHIVPEPRDVCLLDGVLHVHDGLDIVLPGGEDALELGQQFMAGDDHLGLGLIETMDNTILSQVGVDCDNRQGLLETSLRYC